MMKTPRLKEFGVSFASSGLGLSKSEEFEQNYGHGQIYVWSRKPVCETRILILQL